MANPKDSSLLEHVNLAKAHYLFASTSSDNTNLNIIYSAYCAKQALPEVPVLHTVCKVKNKTLLNALSNRHLFAIDFTNMTTRTLHYNLIQARWLVNECGPHKCIHNFSQLNAITILIAGENAFTSELVVRLVEIGVYGLSHKMSIILVDRNATEIYSNIVRSYPLINELVNIQTFTPQEFDEKQYQHIIAHSPPDIVYVCSVETGEKLLILQNLSTLQNKVPSY